MVYRTIKNWTRINQNLCDSEPVVTKGLPYVFLMTSLSACATYIKQGIGVPRRSATELWNY